MSRIKLDLSQFKHVKSDDKSTTLKHKDGHTLCLAHGGLSKINQDQLKALANMAKNDEQPIDKSEAKQEAKSIKAKSVVDGVSQAIKGRDEAPHGKVISVPSKQEEAEKKYGKVKMMAEGGDVPPALAPSAEEKAPSIVPDVATMPAPEVNPDQAYQQMYQQIYADQKRDNPGMPDSEHQRIALQFATNAKERDEASKASVLAKQVAADSAEKMNSAWQEDMKSKIGIQPQAAPEQSAQFPVDTGAATEKGVEAAQQQAQPVQMASNIPGDAQSIAEQGYHEGRAGIQQMANAQANLANQQAQQLADNVKAQQDAQSSYKTHFDELESERQAHMEDIKNGYVDPNKYWTGDSQGNGGHSKISAGIGMILAGFNPTNNPNAAINFLNHQMEMNLQAQKENLGAKNSLLSANLRQFGNLKDASDMTRLMQVDVLRNQLQQSAAKAQSPMAQAAAQSALSQLDMQYAPMAQQFAMRRAMMNLANNGANGDPSDTRAAEQMIAMARMTNPEMAKEMESRLVPGVGMAKMPLPTEARSEIIGKQNFDKMAQHYVQWAKKNSGSLSPAKINEGAAMAAELQGAYRQAVKGGVYKEGEQEFIEKLIPKDPSQFAASIRTLPKLNALIQSNNSQLNNLKQGYGLPVKQISQPNNAQQALAWAKANPGPKAEAILKALGQK